MSPVNKPARSRKFGGAADDLYWMRFTLPFRLNHINLYALTQKTAGCFWIVASIVGNCKPVAMMLKGPLAGRPICGLIVSIITPTTLVMQAT